jgi:capsular polysaccharide export protein
LFIRSMGAFMTVQAPIAGGRNSTRIRSLSFYFSLALGFITLLRLVLHPRDKAIALGFFVNKAEGALLPAAICPDATFIRINFPQRKRGWNAENFRWLVRLLKQAAGDRQIYGLTWGCRDQLNHGYELSHEFNTFYRIEHGLIRGASTPAGNLRTSFIVNARSIYFDGRASSDFEEKLNDLPRGELIQTEAGRRVLDFVLNSNSSKYSLREQHHESVSGDDLLIVGQCTGDQSIEQTEALARTNTGLVDLVAEKMLSSRTYRSVCYKPHPKNSGTAADLAYLKANYPTIRIIDGDISIVTLLKAKPTVATLTSGAGLEAALRGCSVHCFGISFYSNWGFTTDYIPCRRRRNQLSADDVFLYMLLKQTAYVDWRTRKRITATEAFGLAGA